MTITFYDIPSTFAEKAFSGNTWKARLALNFKRIPYKTEWIEFPEIEPLYKKFSIVPTEKKPDGGPLYTLPVIHDPTTGTYVAGSLLIAEYLDSTYPDTPTLFPNGILPFQPAFGVAFGSIISPFFNFVIPTVCSNLNRSSLEYFRRTREAWYGKTMEEMFPKGEQAIVEWAKVREAWRMVDGWYAKNGGNGSFLLGETPSWPDFVIASNLILTRTIFGEESDKWKDVATWNGGRWKKLLKVLDMYIVVI